MRGIARKGRGMECLLADIVRGSEFASMDHMLPTQMKELKAMADVFLPSVKMKFFEKSIKKPVVFG